MYCHFLSSGINTEEQSLTQKFKNSFWLIIPKKIQRFSKSWFSKLVLRDDSIWRMFHKNKILPHETGVCWSFSQRQLVEEDKDIEFQQVSG